MKNFKVLTDSLSWIRKSTKKRGDIVTEKDYPDYKELVNRGFLEEVKEVKEVKKTTSKPKASTKVIKEDKETSSK